MIYMIAAPAVGLCKIGYSSNVDERLKSLNFASPVDLELHKTRRGGFKTEHAIHAAAAVHRVKFEWFSFVPEVVDIFDSTPTLDVDTIYSLQKMLSLVEVAKSEMPLRRRAVRGPTIDWTFHGLEGQTK
jgi:hypothetical protein